MAEIENTPKLTKTGVAPDNILDSAPLPKADTKLSFLDDLLDSKNSVTNIIYANNTMESRTEAKGQPENAHNHGLQGVGVNLSDDSRGVVRIFKANNKKETIGAPETILAA